MKTRTLNLTEGNITKLLIIFALPILCSNIFQQLYNTVDTMIVGNYLGDNAIAAVGASTAIYEFLVGFANGVGNGFAIVVAKFYGQNNKENLKKAVATSIVLSLILSIFIMLLSSFILRPFLEILNTPISLIEDAYSYIYIICMATLITMSYNLISGLLRAIGDSITPLIILVIGTLLNIVLDIYFVSNLNMGIKGAAYATVIAQLFAVMVSIIYVIKKCPILLPSKKDFTYDKSLYTELATQGASMGFMLSIVSLGTIILQGAINQFGNTTLAAHTTARKIFSLLSMPLSTLATASATFTSQNKGCGKYDRVKQGVRKCITISNIWSTIILIIVVFFADDLTKLVSATSNPEVIKTASLYLYTNMPFSYVLGILLILRSALQGLGQKIIPLISSIIELVGKFIFAILLIPFIGYLGVCFSEPIIWICMCLQLLYAFYNNSEIKGAVANI